MSEHTSGPWQELRELVISRYDHPACDQECDSNAKGIALLKAIDAVFEQNAALREAVREASKGKVVNNWLTGGENVCLECGQLPDSGLHDENCWVPKAQALGGDA